MTQTHIRALQPSSSTLATLGAMALLASRTASVIHVVVPREPGVVDTARRLAHQAGVEFSVDLLPRTARVRFDGLLS
jgi:sugar/nucleoside kinase (ribokinase family)